MTLEVVDMDLKRSIIIFQLFLINLICGALLDSHLNETENFTVKVLASELSPLTYFDPGRGFFDGIDIIAVKTIAKRLQVNLVFTKVDDSELIPAQELE